MACAGEGAAGKSGRSAWEDEELGITAAVDTAPADVKRLTAAERDPNVVGDAGSSWSVSNQKQVPLLVRLAYGAPSFATQSITLLISVYAADFYVLLGANLSTLSFFTAMARSFDVITDPVMAWVSDQTRGRMGRRRPYILLGAPFYALFIVLLFSPPRGLTGPALPLWFCLCYTLFYLSDTVANVPYEALGPELTSNHHERNKLFFTSKVFMLIGMLAAALGPALMKSAFQGMQGTPVAVPCASMTSSTDGSLELLAESTCTPGTACHSVVLDWCQEVDAPDGGRTQVYDILLADVAEACGERLPAAACAPEPWAQQCAADGTACATLARYRMDNDDAQRYAFTVVAAFFGLYYLLTVVLCVGTVQEPQGGRQARSPLVGAMLRTFHNQAFRSLLIAWTLEGIGLSAITSMFPFYVRYVLISDSQQGVPFPINPQVYMGICIACLLLAAVGASAFWLWLASRLGKYRAWLLYNFSNVATNLLFFIPQEGQNLRMAVVALLNGVPLGGMFLINSVLSDIIDYDELLYGVRNEAIFSVYATLIPKFVAIPATAIPLALLKAVGFVEPVDLVTQPQPKAVQLYIRGMFIFVPLTCYAVGFLIKLFLFPIKSKETHDAIQEGIQRQRTSDEELQDPITGASLKPLRLAPEQMALAYELENFSLSLLRRSLAHPPILKSAMRRHIAVAAALTVANAVATGVTAAPLMQHAVLSIVPVTLVITLGAMLCFLVISVLRYRAAVSIAVYPLQAVRYVTEQVVHHKSTRASRFLDGRAKSNRGDPPAA